MYAWIILFLFPLPLIGEKIFNMIVATNLLQRYTYHAYVYEYVFVYDTSYISHLICVLFFNFILSTRVSK